MADKTVRLHNKSDKPDNVVERENDVLDRCEAIEAQLPSWLRGFFMYLKTGVLPMTRLSYLSDVKFFFSYLINETELKERCDDIRKIQPEDLDKIKSVDVNIFIDYCRRYKKKPQTLLSEVESIMVPHGGVNCLGRLPVSATTTLSALAHRVGLHHLHRR